MFYYSITGVFSKVCFLQKFLFKCLFIFINKLNIPFNANFPLQFFNKNTESVYFFAEHSESSEKFIDLYMDYSEIYFLIYNENTEILALLNIFLSTPKNFWFASLISCFYFFFFFWKRNLIFWIYSLSLPFVFFLIILYLDYLDGHFS